MPDSIFINVVLPEPFSPSKARISPYLIVRFMLLFATTLPKVLVIPFSSIAYFVSFDFDIITPYPILHYAFKETKGLKLTPCCMCYLTKLFYCYCLVIPFNISCNCCIVKSLSFFSNCLTVICFNNAVKYVEASIKH
ncbi:hypothetical protein SDC9_67902 [bioreactor metagenome]|uniref:Uncharacterized protein n=1 Tax=bioreactor metagenome TaxID=1076179 RepID=A0A644Y090_9ZZZZ